jgi:hypothetical protein
MVWGGWEEEIVRGKAGFFTISYLLTILGSFILYPEDLINKKDVCGIKEYFFLAKNPFREHL